MPEQKLICLSCYRFDSGHYCSNCKSKLHVPAKRLTEVIAARLVMDGAARTLFASQCSLPEAAWPTLLGVSSALPNSVVLVDAAAGTTKDSVTIVGVIWSESFSDDFCRRVDELFTEMLRWKGRVRQAGVIVFQVLVAYETGCSKSEARRLSRFNRRSRGLRFNARLEYSCLDVIRKKATGPWWQLGVVSSQANAALDQLESAKGGSEGTPQEPRGIGDVAKVMLEPFVDFAEGFKLMLRPQLFASRLREGAFGFPDLLKYTLASIVLSTMLAKLTHTEFGEASSIPILNEAEMAAMFLGIYALTGALFHLFVKVAGGKGTFKESFFATSLVSLTCLPIATVMEGLLGKDQGGTNYTGTLYLAALFGRLHDISTSRALWFILGGTIPVAVVVGIAAAILH